ncbi:MAG: phosphate acetyltransferase [Bacilli bacterium]|nr:phosphate acetyltransferase [Bacilli bacterium]
MEILERFRSKAIKSIKTIVLPEGEDERIIMAASKIMSDNLAKIILVGREGIIKSKAINLNAELNDALIIDPDNFDKKEVYAEKLYELRKHKGISINDAKKMLCNNIYLATMMVKLGEADGMVAGVLNTTSEVLKPALQIIKTAPNNDIVSSFFIMLVPDCEYGDNGLFLFADCGLNIEPTSEQLAAIAVQTAETALQLCDMVPKVALLSFSTKGSTEDESLFKIREALAIVKKTAPALAIDGELQLDASIDPKVALRKAPNSDIAGKANVLIFPDLEAGNIGYKLVEKLAKAKAIGPICQGLAKPVNDVSRGCSADDVVSAIIVTAVQAQNNDL